MPLRRPAEPCAWCAGPPQKIGERVTRITPVAKAHMDALLTSLNLAVQQGIDPDPDNAVAVATFAYQDAAGHPQQVWLYMCPIALASLVELPPVVPSFHVSSRKPASTQT